MGGMWWLDAEPVLHVVPVRWVKGVAGGPVLLFTRRVLQKPPPAAPSKNINLNVGNPHVQ